MRKKESAQSNAKIAFIFFIFLFLIVGISSIFKVVIIIREGQFDSSRRFTFTVANNEKVHVVSHSAGSNSLIIFQMNGKTSSDRAGQLLGIPIDGFISAKDSGENLEASSFLLKSIIGYSNLQTNLTIVDLIKLYFSVKAVPENFVTIREISLEEDMAKIDKIVGRLVFDELIEKEGKTIQIINGTDVGGLGSRLARLVTNAGGNVILVATADSPKKKSIIAYTGKKTYTVEKLEKVLKYEIIENRENAISDITITIGEDKLNSLFF